MTNDQIQDLAMTRYTYKPAPAPRRGENLLAAILCALILGAPFAFYFWSMKP